MRLIQRSVWTTVANERWLTEFNKPGVEVLVTHRSDHCPLFLNNEDINARLTRRKIFRCKAKWALKDDGDQPIRLAWQTGAFPQILCCSKELVKWSASRKKFLKQELDEKINLLKVLQLQIPPDMMAIKSLEKEIVEKGTQGFISKVNSDMNHSLTEPFTREEVEVALKQMTPLK